MLIRNRLLGSSALYLLSPKEDGTPTDEELKQKQRESIAVDKGGRTNKEEEKKEDDNKEEEEKEETETKEEEETNEEKLEASEEKIEELEEELEDKTLSAKDREKLEKRIVKERNKVKDLREENARLKAQLEAKPNDEKSYTEADVEAKAEELANRKAAEREFTKVVNQLAKDAEKADKKFKENLSEIADDNNPLPGALISMLSDLDNGGAVLAYLAANSDEYEEIVSQTPMKAIKSLSKISDTLIAKTKKSVSKAPPVKQPVEGNGSSNDARASDKDDMATWIKKRNKEAEQHRRMKLGLN